MPQSDDDLYSLAARSHDAQIPIDSPMTAPTRRASYTVSDSVLQRFNTVVQHGERGHVMEELLKQALTVREVELERLANAFMTDPAFTECRDNEIQWHTTNADGLDRLV